MVQRLAKTLNVVCVCVREREREKELGGVKEGELRCMHSNSMGLGIELKLSCF